MWVLSSGPGIKPMSPALAGGFFFFFLAGGFLTTGPPGNSLKFVFEVCGSFFFFKLKANYFTILWVLPYTDMNQPLVYMCPVSLLDK